MWLLPGTSSVVLSEQYPSLDCDTVTGCMMGGAGTPYLPAGSNITCWLFRGDREVMDTYVK